MSMSDSTTEARKLISGSESHGSRGINLVDYKPEPYAFRIPDRRNKTGDSYIISPPNWLLLDHTIAVIWSIFNTHSPTKWLDIDDLKWAHEFLKEVRNSKGENPPDVKVCLSEIQDRLISLYAQLSHRKEDNEKNKGVTSPQESNASILKQKSSQLQTSKLHKKESEPKIISFEIKEPSKKLNKSDTNAARRPQAGDTRQETKEKKRSLPVPQRKAGHPSSSTGTCKRSETQVSSQQSIAVNSTPRKEVASARTENFFTEVFQRNRSRDRVLGSNNFSKITNQTGRAQPQANNSAQNLEPKEEVQEEKEERITLQYKRTPTTEELNCEEEAYTKLKNEIRNLTKNPKISKDQVLKFLSDWREEQMERLQGELKRLSSIEEFMKSVKPDGFVPYVEEELARKLESIQCRKGLSKPS